MVLPQRTWSQIRNASLHMKGTLPYAGITNVLEVMSVGVRPNKIVGNVPASRL